MSRSELYMVCLAAVDGVAFNTYVDYKWSIFILGVKLYFFLLICFKLAIRIPDFTPSITRSTTSRFTPTTDFNQNFMELAVL